MKGEGDGSSDKKGSVANKCRGKFEPRCNEINVLFAYSSETYHTYTYTVCTVDEEAIYKIQIDSVDVLCD